MYKKLEQYYDIAITIAFLLWGSTFQSILLRRGAFILVFCLLLSQLVVMKLDDGFSFHSIKEIIGIRDILLIIAMVSFRVANYLYYSENGDFNGNVIWASVPIMLYLYGKFFVLQHKEDTYQNVQRVIVPFGAGLMTFFWFSAISYHVNGPMGKDGRNWILLFIGDGPIRATYFTFYVLLLVALIPWAIIKWKKQRLLCSYIIISGISSLLWFWVVVKTRLPMIVFFVALIFAGCLILVEKRINGEFSNKRMLQVGGIVGLALGVFVIAFVTNLGGLKTMVFSSTLFRDGNILNEPRLRMAWNGLSGLAQYPFGNNHTEVYTNMKTTHIYWTELAYCGGFIPFVSGILWLILSLFDAVKISISKIIRLEEKMLLLLSFLAVFLYSCTEALRDMFAIFIVMLMAGLLRGKVLIEQDK